MVWIRKTFAIAVVLSLAAAASPSPSSARSGPGRWSFGPGAEYFLRTIEWDGAARASQIGLLAATFQAEYVVEQGLIVSAVAGYASSSLDGIVFRKLPFSLEWQAGGMTGTLLGAGMTKTLLSPGDFEIGAEVRFVVFWGREKSKEIEGLNDQGTVRAEPRWMSAAAGPFIRYRAWAPFVPYIIVYYNNLWGQLRMEETLSRLGGSETKKVAARERFGAVAGLRIGPLSSLSFAAEVDLLPSRTHIDLGARFKALATF
jgi:hypothetical protein